MVGAFLLCGALIALTGLVRPLARALQRLPQALSAAVLAGVLPVRRNAPDPDRLATVAAEPAANGYWLARLDRVAALLDADADRR